MVTRRTIIPVEIMRDKNPRICVWYVVRTHDADYRVMIDEAISFTTTLRSEALRVAREKAKEFESSCVT